MLIAILIAREKELNHTLTASRILAALRTRREPFAADIFSVLLFPCFVGHSIICLDALGDAGAKKTIRDLFVALLEFTKLSVYIYSQSHD